MDWQLRIALLIIGIGLIGFIVFDYKRRKKSAIEKQKLIEQMHNTASSVDAAGFDHTGVGNVRKVNAEPTIGDESISQSAENEPLVAQIKTSDNLSSSSKVNVSNQHSESNSSEQAHAETASKTEVDRKEQQGEQLSFDEVLEPELVFSLILKSKDEMPYKGSDFMPIFLSQGLRHGEMGIFHRYQSIKGKTGSLLYSVANAVKPGTFDLDDIEQFETPAFAFFMTLPGPADPVATYEAMVKTMRMMSEELGGQILDPTKSVYTEQTHQHQLEQVKAYCLKHQINLK